MGGGCRGFFAIEPYITASFLKIGALKKLLMKSLIGLITGFRLHEAAYQSKYFMGFLMPDYAPSRMKAMMETIDGFAFFETAKLILADDSVPKFHDKPYILAINDNDGTVDTPRILQLFGHLNNVLIVKTTSKHYPEHPTKAYFKSNIKPEDMKRIIKFCRQNG